MGVIWPEQFEFGCNIVFNDGFILVIVVLAIVVVTIKVLWVVVEEINELLIGEITVIGLIVNFSFEIVLWMGEFELVVSWIVSVFGLFVIILTILSEIVFWVVLTISDLIVVNWLFVKVWISDKIESKSEYGSVVKLNSIKDKSTKFSIKVNLQKLES